MAHDGKTPAGKQRWVCKRRATNGEWESCYTTTDPTAPYRDQSSTAKGADQNPQFRRALGDVKRFIITSAQNATPPHQPFLSALKAYAKENNAELIVIPIRYKNPTSRWTASQENAEHWDLRLKEYLYNQRKKLNENLVLLADIKVRPTAEKPLTGFETITASESGILGHSKLQLVSVPTPHGKLPKLMTTTGSCTQANYTDSKAGKKGEHHHVIGAAVVDVQGKAFHLRQINALKDGSFIDLDKEYLPDASTVLDKGYVSPLELFPVYAKIPPGTVRKAGRALGLVMGDMHVRFADPAVVRATFTGKDSIVAKLNPVELVFHDLLDGYSRNPHHRFDPFIEIAKRRSNLHLVADEVEDTIKFLRKHSKGRSAVVVSSNHDDFFRRWIMDTDWRRDPDNANIYLETALMMARSAKIGTGGTEYTDPFAHWVNKRLTADDQVRVLRPDESHTIGKIECGFHGHRGPNGAKGSVNNLSRIGVRAITGHGHSPAIEHGHYRVGTSTYLKLEYTEGPSSWLNTHCVVYANGKRSLINVVFGSWYLDAAG